jgi:putative hydrolase of the HAD superfamily
VRAWEEHGSFTLYEDALPALASLREHGVKIGLISNGSRDLDEFVAHHGLDADCAIGSRDFGRTKPHPEIFRHALALLEVEPPEAAMIGDSYEDDIEGARALGMKAFLLDRDGRRPNEPDRLPDLFALPAALGLTPG